MRVLRLAHVNVSVDDLDRARDFYGRVLGLEPAPRPADAGTRPGCWFRIGDAELHLSLEPCEGNAKSRRHVAYEVDDLEAARARLEGEGYAIEEGRPLPGLTRLFVRDPFGNRIELFARARVPAA